MKRLLLLLTVVFCLTANAFGEFVVERPPPKEVSYGVGSIFPPLSLGAFGEFLAFPWGIATGPDTVNQLGVGGLGGIYYVFGYRSVVLSVMAIFDGRFQFGQRFALDMETGLGFLMSRAMAFCGTIGVAPVFAINERYTLRATAAVDFTSNPGFDALDPDSAEFLIWFRLSVGLLTALGYERLIFTDSE
jgi:hypothetical protein